MHHCLHRKGIRVGQLMANFISKWFQQAAAIEHYRCRIAEVIADLDKERWRNDQLEKQIQAERKKTDKFVVQYANACGKLVGQKNLFTEVHEKEESRGADDNYSEAELQKYTYFAEIMRNQDIDEGKDVPDLQTYVNIIKEDPAKYIFS